MSALTSAARNAWKTAVSEAAGSGSSEVQPAHLMLALLAVGTNVTDQDAAAEADALTRAFTTSGVDPSALRTSVRRQVKTGRTVVRSGVIHRSAETRTYFEKAQTLADGGRVAVGHLLAALLEDPDRTISKALRRARIDLVVLRASLLRSATAFASAPLVSEPVPTVAPPGIPAGDTSPTADSPRGIRRSRETAARDEVRSESGAENASAESVIERFGRDLTEAARGGMLSPVVGRRGEILQVIRALARRKKNNPVLIGEAGVGKTAIIEAVALRAAAGKDPQVLGNKRIVELDMASLMSGTTLRGQFEERMKRLVDEASSDPDLILFIDEIHTIMGAGAGAAQILKPALSRGAIKLIGATTVDEYRKHIEVDPAMDRRFERIHVDEPSRDEAVEMLMGMKDSLERHHDAGFHEGAIHAAVDLSIRVDVDHRLPDKAIDLLDRAASRATVPELSAQNLPGGDRSLGQELCITALDVAHVLAEKMDMPVEIVAGHLDPGGARRLLDLGAFLRRSLRGQDRAIETVAERMVLAHASVVERRGPLATMLFLGPSGVGKTELAKQLALFLFGSERNLIRLDMSEFKEEHSVSKLLGSPPGYVGSDQEGHLTGQIRRKPYSVVLLDEVEKSHPRVYDVFLQVFDEGRLTDSKGRTADARNCIFVLTSNVRPNADPDDRTAIDTALRGWFRPEFINRIDEIVSFDPLTEASVGGILDDLLERLSAQLLARHGVRLEISPGARGLLARLGYHPEYGARELRRTIERHVQAPVSRRVLSGEMSAHQIWRLESDGSTVALRYVQGVPVPGAATDDAAGNADVR